MNAILREPVLLDDPPPAQTLPNQELQAKVVKALEAFLPSHSVLWSVEASNL